MDTHLYFVRHGETSWNLAGRFQGYTDIPLNETGQEQARTLQEQFDEIAFDAVYSSDLMRAAETAKIITRNRFEIIQDSRIRELFCGDWEGKTMKELIEAGEPLQQYFLDPLTTPPTGGETILDIFNRVGTFLNEIKKQYVGKKVLIVSHGGTTRTALSYLLLGSPELYNKLYINNCGVSEIVIEPSGRTRLKYLNGNPSHISL